MESVAEELKACVLAFGFCFTCTGDRQQICLFESDVAFGKDSYILGGPLEKYFLKSSGHIC